MVAIFVQASVCYLEHIRHHNSAIKFMWKDVV